MKKLMIITALVALIVACGAAPGPRATVERMFKAVQNADGKTVVECLSSDAVAELNEALADMKENPEESAMMMAFIGIEATADDIRNLDAAGFITMILGSEMFAGELEGVSISYGAERIEGDAAYVEVTFNGDTEEVKLVKENGRWVMADFEMF